MAKIKCPGCGADIDTESGRAEYSAPADAPRDSGGYTEQECADDNNKGGGIPDSPLKQSRFWRRK